MPSKFFYYDGGATFGITVYNAIGRLTTADTSNRLQGNSFSYDAVGNMVENGLNVFNAENQWTQETCYNISYRYDGDGWRR
jgi:hypothetical protein